MAMTIWASGAAEADGFDDRKVTTFVEPDSAAVELTGVSEVGEVVQGPGVPGWLRECSYGSWSLLEKDVYLAQFFGSGSPSEDGIRAGGGDPGEEWFVVFCSPGPEARAVSPEVATTGVLATWPVSDPPPQIFIEWLIAYGYALIEVPVQVGSSSPVGDVVAPLITQLDTWLWVDPVVWQSVSATTPSVFGVTATVTATPYEVEFWSSEGEYVNCGNNAGSVYDYSRDGDDQDTVCSVTFRNASSVADQSLTSTVRWAVSYSCSSAACPSGTLPDFVITNTRDVRVAEIMGVLVASE